MKKTMKIELETTDIQRIIIGLIHGVTSNDCTLHYAKEDVQKLIDTFGEMNKMCHYGNDYTLDITVKEKRV